ncbi:MAG: n-acetylglutamate synthase [Bacteroidota bacterium]
MQSPNLSFTLEGKIFKPLQQADHGEVDDETRFHYRQKGEIIWATYEGGAIIFGTLSGYMEGSRLFFTYQHRNQAGKFMTGSCETQIELKGDKLLLHESWQWTSGDQAKGKSVLQEV